MKAFCYTQEKDSTRIEELVPRLTEAYNNFEYAKSKNLLEIALKNIDTFQMKDRQKIYLYGSFLAFHNNNTEQAAQYFWKLLNTDPTYALDPVTTPPKLLTLFQKTKIDYLEELNTRLREAQNESFSQSFPWRAVVFPGWEQWYRGYKAKGIALALGGLTTLTGTVISIIQTHNRENEYRAAKDPAIIQSRYDAYQAAYQRQYYFGYTFLGLWAFSHLDLVVWSQPKMRLSPSFTYNTENIPIILTSLTITF